MNQLMLYDDDIKSAGEFFIPLSSPRGEHLKTILQVKEGDTLRVALLNQGRGEATVFRVGEEGFLLKVKGEGAWEATTPNLPPLHLMIGVTRPPSMKKIMEYASGMGVASYHWLQTTLADKSYWTSKILREESYQPLMDLGLSQSNFYYQRPEFKTYRGKRDSWPYLTDTASSDGGDGSEVQKFLLAPDTQLSWNDYSLSSKKPIVLAIGPERGFTRDEEQFLQEKNFRPVKISQTLLRVELAVFFALAQIEFTLWPKSS